LKKKYKTEYKPDIFNVDLTVFPTPEFKLFISSNIPGLDFNGTLQSSEKKIVMLSSFGRTEKLSKGKN